MTNLDQELTDTLDAIRRENLNAPNWQASSSKLLKEITDTWDRRKVALDISIIANIAWFTQYRGNTNV